MSLEKLIESHYAPKRGNELLIEMIESKLNEQAFGSIYSKARINLLSGNPETEAYKELQSLFSGLFKGQGELLSDRLATVNSFLTADKAQVKSFPINVAFSSILLIQELKEALEKLEASSAGFQMETIIAQIIQGSKLANNSIVDVIKIQKSSGGEEFIRDYSIKTLSATSLKIKGSFLNLCKKFANLERNEEYEYLIITKDIKNGVYRFYEWVLPYENFFTQITYPKGFLEAGGNDGNFIFKDDVDLQAIEKLIQKEGLSLEILSKKITESQNIYYLYFPILTEKEADSILSRIQTGYESATYRNAGEAMIDRFKNLEFIEDNKDLFTNADAFSLETQFSISKGVIDANVKESGALIGEFYLSDERLQQISDEYQKTLVGKMNQILKDNQEVLSNMNSYFSTMNKESAENTFQAMTKVRKGFRQFTSKVTPEISDSEG
jgi:hypothetical protein